MRGRGFQSTARELAPQISSTINLVASSLGITIVPQCMQQIRTDVVRYLRLRDTPLCATLGVAYRSCASDAALLNLVELVVRYAKG
jgi:DNA-binding transcriptional LysR family regulator